LLNSHYPSPTHTFFRGDEETFFESVNLLPLQLISILDIPMSHSGAVYVSENRFSATSRLGSPNQHNRETLISPPTISGVISEARSSNETNESDSKNRLRL
jgi:hypothetical protein